MVTWRLNLVDLVVGLPRHRPMVEGCGAARRRQNCEITNAEPRALSGFIEIRRKTCARPAVVLCN